MHAAAADGLTRRDCAVRDRFADLADEAEPLAGGSADAFRGRFAPRPRGPDPDRAPDSVPFPEARWSWDAAGDPARSPEMDPLTKKDALQEARLNEVMFDALNMRVGLLLDLRGSLQLRSTYTGLLILAGVQGLTWSSERRRATRTAWNVVGSLPVNEDGVINLSLFFVADAELTAVARSAAFYAGDVPGLPDTPPDFADTDEAVAAGMASMDSPFEPTQATFIELQSS